MYPHEVIYSLKTCNYVLDKQVSSNCYKAIDTNLMIYFDTFWEDSQRPEEYKIENLFERRLGLC